MSRRKNIFAGFLCAALWLVAGSGRAETACWSDNFETNTASRWTTNSVWKIGAPTAGPAKPHSGTRCAATGLTANAPANADARLICTNYNGASTLTIPDADQYPRLRYWQWFNFVNAQGYVEIREEGSTNWQVISATNFSSGSTADYSSGVWSRPSIDLSAFAGANVQIAFHFTSWGGGWGSDPGWYIDDVAVVTNTPVFNNLEGFETGFDDWSVDAGTWEIGKPTSGPNAAHGGTNCAGTVLAGNYGWNMNTRLISPPFTVPATNRPTLRYAQWFKFVNAGGFVEVNNGDTSNTSITNTTITTNVVFSSFDTNTYQLSGAMVTGYSTPFYWNQTIGGWTNATKTLKNVQDTSGYVPKAGYYFEAGTTPLYGGVNTEYIGGITPLPQSAGATNYLAWQGMIWTNVARNTNTPVGYFGTNYSYTYTTNTTVVTSASNWQPLSTTNLSQANASISSGGWTNAALDLSDYAGQTVQVAFHFMSWGSGWGNAPGWYVDDVLVAENPELAMPDTQTNYAGQTLTVDLSTAATDNTFPDDTLTFSLPSHSTNVSITADGILTWTNTGIKNGVLTWTNNSVAPGTNVIYVKVSDTTETNYGPLLATTNSFEIIFLPPPAPVLTVPTNQTISIRQTLTVTNFATNSFLPSSKFTFSLLSSFTNVTLTTNGVLTWTNTAALPGTNVISVTVKDNSVPPLYATNSFTIQVMPPPPALTAVQLLAGSHSFQFTVNTLSNTTWRIMASTNLLDWQPVFTNMAGTDGTLQFTDLLATNFPQRFYRAVYP
jgi:hypothetical protein